MRKYLGILAAAAISLAGCSSATPAAQTVISTVPTTVVTTKLTTSVATKTTTLTTTERVTETETVTPPPTTSAQRVSEAAACQLFLRGPGGTDNASLRLSGLLTNELAKPEIDAAAAKTINTKATSIRQEFESLKARAPLDWSPFLQAHIDVADEIIRVSSEGGSLNINTDDLRAAGFELLSRCGS